MTCTWKAGRGDDSWTCTGDHSGGVHHFEGAAWTLPLAMTDIAGLTRLEPSGAGVDVREMLAERGLAGKDGPQ